MKKLNFNQTFLLYEKMKAKAEKISAMNDKIIIVVSTRIKARKNAKKTKS